LRYTWAQTSQLPCWKALIDVTRGRGRHSYVRRPRRPDAGNAKFGHRRQWVAACTRTPAACRAASTGSTGTAAGTSASAPSVVRSSSARFLCVVCVPPGYGVSTDRSVRCAGPCGRHAYTVCTQQVSVGRHAENNERVPRVTPEFVMSVD
jgi:hypothetical protein